MVFDKSRTKRNGINYYSQPVGYDDWKEFEFQYNLYVSTLKKEINQLTKKNILVNPTYITLHPFILNLLC